MKVSDCKIFDVYPYNMAAKIFDIGRSDSRYAIHATRIDPTRLIETVAELTDREQEILKYRFKEGLTLKVTGERIGVSMERIRQVEAKALRKLRHPARVRQYTMVPMAEFLEEKAKCQEYAKENIRLRDRLAEFERAEETQKALEPKEEVGIEELNLSVRAYNCLKRQCRTLSDCEKLTRAKLRMIRNLGKHSEEEIVAKLKEWGITLE